jgi:hypothetical protein
MATEKTQETDTETDNELTFAEEIAAFRILVSKAPAGELTPNSRFVILR